MVDGKETDKVDLSWDNDTTIELPKEAVGKYVHVYLNSEDGQQQNVGEFTITVE